MRLTLLLGIFLLLVALLWIEASHRIVVAAHPLLDDRFWWDWWVQFGVAAGTLLAVAVALFGDWIKAGWLGPRLKIEVLNPLGEEATVSLGGTTAPAHFYHLLVTNEWETSRVEDAQVFIMGVEEILAGAPPGRLPGTRGIPIQWRHQALYPPTGRSIGAGAEADIVSVSARTMTTAGPTLMLHPFIVTPLNMRTFWEVPCELVISVQVRSKQRDSKVFQVRVWWDGAYQTGASGMQDHLHVAVLPSQPQAWS